IAEPADQLLIDVLRALDPHPVCAHRVEAAGVFQPAACLQPSKVQTDVQPDARRRLHDRELLFPTKAYVRLFGCDLDIPAEPDDLFMDPGVEGLESCPVTREKIDAVSLHHLGVCYRRASRLVSDEVGVAV